MNAYHRDTWVEVDADAIASNVKSARSLYQKKGKELELMAVVKADGYGHGATEVAKVALAAGATHLAVAFLDEALLLRREGISAPILVMGYVPPEDAEYAQRERIAVTVFQLEWLKRATAVVKAEAPPLAVHIKVDTGMGRIGVRSSGEVVTVASFVKEEERFSLEGLFTHFATADENDVSYFNRQHRLFMDVVTIFEKESLAPTHIHCGNSAAGLRFPAKMFTMFRFGISMYGLTPSPEITDQLPFGLKPALSLRTKLVQVKKMSAGEGISYGATYTTKEGEWIGTLPVGYADGWIRANSTTGGYVLVNGEKAPFVGKICMDQCMIRLPRQLEVGTTVTLIGEDAGAEITMGAVAARLETINYEVPCLLSKRMPRVYKKGGEVYHVSSLLNRK
ncbi:alanine racemase [Shouchella shacheensis]|uniref:alanine racemase n=1 Tax=Shouchella shacheensis TaxID=1649580 RepID=UPI00073FAB86|nr:alanine racemase [Shouchella shacheensis]